LENVQRVHMSDTTIHAPLRAFAATGAVALALMLPVTAFATLGEPDTSVQTDQSQLKGSVKVISRANYRVHEMTLPSKTMLRQYVGPDGIVFAVTWSGPAIPDLRQTLGNYFDTYVAGASQAHAKRRHVSVASAELVVNAGGHMRSFRGRAYLPKSIPAGVSVEELP